jgi:transaldolase
MNALLELKKHKQSVWLDYIRRDLILGGELKRLVEQDGLGGVTSNPTIFEKAIDGGTQYDEALRASSARDSSTEPRMIYDEIAVEDVRSAADVLRPVYDATGGADGFVSIEPPPQLAADTKGTIQEARRLHELVDRPNLMIKVVATKDGVAAVEALIAEGVNVNITLIFSLAWSKYSNVLKSWVMAPAPNGLGKTLRTNSGPCNVVLRPFRIFSQEHRVQPATMIGLKQIEFFDHAGIKVVLYVRIKNPWLKR